MSNQEFVRAPVLQHVFLFHLARKKNGLLRPGFQTKGVLMEIRAFGHLLNSACPLCSLPSNKQCEQHLLPSSVCRRLQPTWLSDRALLEEVNS